MSDDNNDAVVKKVMSILQGAEVTPKESLDLVKTLHADRRFGLARRMLEKLVSRDVYRKQLDADPARKRTVSQKRALSTYKDPDLQTDRKYALALELLQAADPLDASVDQETLGQAGAIYKRMWEHTGRERLLETSLAFYERGCRQGVGKDSGYTAINAAFVLDLLADLETPEGQPTTEIPQGAVQRRARARAIRADIVKELSTWTRNKENEWRDTTCWYLVTLGEACFGLGDYAAADHWLGKAAALPGVPDWERESSARQLATLWRLQQRERALQGQPVDTRGREVLENFLGDAKAALSSCIRGKVGLALSGGGFRASLYHIGVLAKLAELDLLRHVECVSCVSGGSIIGAHYYLEVRKLLQEKPDAAITREDYIAIVERVCDDFLAGVQRNIRTRIAAEWLTNLKMIFLPDYSRTLRAGELYEREIFSRVKDGGGGGDRWLNELMIDPPDGPKPFRPKDHNWRRAAKAPILVLNATTLNTGHNWQFTSSWMGEPPTDIDSEVDGNFRLRRMYYGEAPARYQRMRLGHAVAASACVPGLFEPLALPQLYERVPQYGDAAVRPVVRLVDGGVHDNQGSSALLEQGCSVLLVSDASGQMGDQDFPSNGLLGVPLRSNSVLQARVRVSQYQDLSSRQRGGILKGVMFIHLKKGLETRAVDWIGTHDPADPPNNDPLLPYGIQRDMQRQLAAVRTDLDSFSEAEAYSLMASGYFMTESSLAKPILGFPVASSARSAWEFLQVQPMLADADIESWLRRQLKVADKLALRVWLVTRRLQIAIGVVAILLLTFIGRQIYQSRDMISQIWTEPLFVFKPTPGDLAWTLGMTLISILGLGLLARALDYRKTLQQMLIGIGMGTFGFLLARLHLHVFDRLFLWQGRIARAHRSTPGRG
jgi:predicted acylesterase/phospholipase RssA